MFKRKRKEPPMPHTSRTGHSTRKPSAIVDALARGEQAELSSIDVFAANMEGDKERTNGKR